MAPLDNATAAVVSRHLHAARTLQVRNAIAAQAIDLETSQDALRITRALARGWAIIDRLGRAPMDLWAGDRGGAWDYERIKTLQAYALIARANADADAHDRELRGIADVIDAMIVWEAESASARRLLTDVIPIPSLAALPVTLAPVAAGALDAAAIATRPNPPVDQQSSFDGAVAA